MNFYEERAQQTDVELYERSPTLEPEYTRAHALTEKVMAEFEADHFKPILKKLADAVTEHLWDILRDHIVSDTTYNVAGHIQNRIEESIKALLGGQKWAIEKYALAKYDQAGIREAVAKAVPQEIQDLRIAELEEEVERLKENLGWARRY